ncbi:MAG: cobyric acid synthase [Hyphomicrobiales bacterium]|nr:cobyric acid synthase [Hyphomicrobiales bacterium]
MLMGTGSDVGKSLVAAGLCRAFARRGLKVMPFKPQNMSNNAAVTSDGGEIGRAQALQARAANQPASVHMNPVLLKPETNTGAQIIVQGKRAATMTAGDYFKNRQQFMPAIIESFRKLADQADLIIVEGAGSPAEVNLRDGDLANMGFARAVDIPAFLVGDIHRGGVIASIVGTLAVLEPEDRGRLKGFIINKFHGDVKLFENGKTYLTENTGLPCLGVIPHFAAARNLPAEDAVALEDMLINNSKDCKICVLKLPRIANFDDLDPLRLEPGVSVRFLELGQPVPGDTDLVIIPGSKSTMADLAAVRATGWDIDLQAHVRRGGRVLGLCGGFQMLGHTIHDPEGLEGAAGSVKGLSLLDVETTLLPEKILTRITATHVASDQKIDGYEIHLGASQGADCDRPFARIGSADDGATSIDGLVSGTYIHGCFANDGFRSAYLKSLGAASSDLVFESLIEKTLDELSAHLEQHLDLDLMLELAGGI